MAVLVFTATERGLSMMGIQVYSSEEALHFIIENRRSPLTSICARYCLSVCCCLSSKHKCRSLYPPFFLSSIPPLVETSSVLILFKSCSYAYIIFEVNKNHSQMQ